MESLHERCNLTDIETSDLNLMDVIDEEIEARAMRLITQVHEDKIWKLDKVIASLPLL